MTEQIDATAQTGEASQERAPASGASAAKRRGGGLSSMLLADLKSLAGGLGVAGAGSMKKAQLVEAIKAAQAGGGEGRPAPEQKPKQKSERTPAPQQEPAPEQQPEQKPEQEPAPRHEPARGDEPRSQRPARDQGNRDQGSRDQGGRDQGGRDQGGRDQGAKAQSGRQERASKQQGDQQARSQGTQQARQQRGQNEPKDQPSDQSRDQSKDRPKDRTKDQAQDRQGHQPKDQPNQNQNRDRDQNQGHTPGQDDDDDEGGRRGRRRRGRERDRTRRGDVDTTILEDDVLVPAAGILDVLDNYAFVRTSGYLAGTDDVYVSLTMVRKYGLRRGDAVTGQVRQPREGERKEKFNPMVKIESVNGQEPDASRSRPDFTRLTPLYASERLRLETDPGNTVGRLVDLLAPVGKGQRGLIVAPPGSGRTAMLQSLAASITANNPECHLMVVLVDERPEEVTDVERHVKGEVIASTFDRQPADHTAVAELAVERAKRLVELGHDVVVLLDGLTRLTRAYNLAIPSSGRSLEGGLDPQALHPAKRLFGAARNIENGGSLTILATAVSDSDSVTDTRILEEFRGTGNHEIRLRGDLAARRIFPAVDVAASGTRRADLLLSGEELGIVEALRRGLTEAEPQQALELLLDRLGTTQTNYELLRQVQLSDAAGGIGR